MKTWSKLAKNKRRPSEYEIVTTNLQTRNRHRDSAYELSPAPDLSMNEWYRKHVFDSPLQHDDWEEFRDPDALIYRVYTRSQDSQEEYIDGVLNEHNEIGHDADLAPEWLDTLETLYTPRRYLQVTLQMTAAYILQIAPASTITACAGFQEEMSFAGCNALLIGLGSYRSRTRIEPSVKTSESTGGRCSSAGSARVDGENPISYDWKASLPTIWSRR